METFVSLNLPPGLYKNGTPYQAKGRWRDGHLVRWLPDGSQYPPMLPVGGWTKATTDTGGDIQVLGFPRNAHSWRKNDSTAWLATGTQSKLYAYSSSVLTDITPAGLVAGQANGSIISGAGPYGAGAYGAGPYGTGSNVGAISDADTWSFDNFGEILIACLTSDGKIYESTPTTQATQVTNSPTGCRGVVVTPERFVMALGASSDPRNVAWCSQAARTTWTPAASNSAGSFVLQTNGRLICGERTARETLLFTDADLWGAEYIGGPFVYSFRQRGDNCGIIGPNAVAIAEGAAFWMADGHFFAYDGAVRQVPCEVSDYVFGNLNRNQRAKIAAVPLAQFGEVWWFYPSATQTGLENDRYVALNYRGPKPFWMTGTLGRAAGVGAGVFAQPLLWNTDGKLYAHETGSDRAGQVASVESGPLELGNGDRVLRAQSLIPDEKFLGDVTASFFASYQPTGTETSVGPLQVSAKTDVRITGRQLRLRLAENNIVTGLTADQMVMTADSNALTADTGPSGGTDWRVGTFRLGILPGGYR